MNIQERFFSKVSVGDGCWEWTGSKMAYGYGNMRDANGKVRLAHRLAWELQVGPVPDGLFIDHICGNRSCVRLDHLRLVTAKENAPRGAEHYNSRKNRCKNGHEFTPENTGSYRTSRYCRTCRSEWAKGYRKVSHESRTPTPRATASSPDTP